MKVTETDGKKLIVFEDGVDDELKANFMALIEDQAVLRRAALAATEEHDKVCREMKLAIKRLDLHKLEHHDEMWGPIDEALKKVLGADVPPGISFNGETNELTISESEPGGGLPEALIGLLGMLKGSKPPECKPDEEDETVH